MSLGAEVRLHPDAFDLLAVGELPMIGALDGSRIVLLEFPDGQIPAGALTAIRYLSDRHVQVMIAHPERNKDVMRDPARIKPFVDAGCLLQVTAASVIGAIRPRALACAHQLLASGMVAVVATDAHNMAHRPPLRGRPVRRSERSTGWGWPID